MGESSDALTLKAGATPGSLWCSVKGSFSRENEIPPVDVVIGVKQRNARPACKNKRSLWHSLWYAKLFYGKTDPLLWKRMIWHQYNAVVSGHFEMPPNALNTRGMLLQMQTRQLNRHIQSGRKSLSNFFCKSCGPWWWTQPVFLFQTPRQYNIMWILTDLISAFLISLIFALHW